MFSTVFRKVACSGLAVFMLGGCATNRGPGLIPRERFNYNEQIIRSQNEQMLLNLVRLRYNDVPLFLDLNGVVTQYSIENSATLSAMTKLINDADAKPQAETTPSLSTGASFAERPTMTYSPLQGEEFAKRILTPIPPENLVLLSQSGWSISRLLLMSVERINGVPNAPTASGPTPELKPVYEKFHEMARAMRTLQRAGLIEAEVRPEGEKKTVWILLGDAGDHPEAAQSLRVVREILGLPAGAKEFKISQTGRGGGQEISLNTRSLLGIFYFLAHAVMPPAEHVEKGFVVVTRDASGQPFDWNQALGGLLRIQSSRKRPEQAFVSAYYRGTWFYVGDTDWNSKSTFNLLHYLFALQSAAAPGQSPLLTLTASNN